MVERSPAGSRKASYHGAFSPLSAVDRASSPGLYVSNQPRTYRTGSLSPRRASSRAATRICCSRYKFKSSINRHIAYGRVRGGCGRFAAGVSVAGVSEQPNLLTRPRPAASTAPSRPPCRPAHCRPGLLAARAVVTRDRIAHVPLCHRQAFRPGPTPILGTARRV